MQVIDGLVVRSRCQATMFPIIYSLAYDSMWLCQDEFRFRDISWWDGSYLTKQRVVGCIWAYSCRPCILSYSVHKMQILPHTKIHPIFAWIILTNINIICILCSSVYQTIVSYPIVYRNLALHPADKMNPKIQNQQWYYDYPQAGLHTIRHILVVCNLSIPASHFLSYCILLLYPIVLLLCCVVSYRLNQANAETRFFSAKA
jgi:hypothetical protein